MRISKRLGILIAGLLALLGFSSWVKDGSDVVQQSMEVEEKEFVNIAQSTQDWTKGR